MNLNHMVLRACRISILILCSFYLLACSNAPPRKLNNICDIFKEKKSWYKDAKKARDRWNIAISTNMAFMYQESSFRAKAKPPRKRILGFIPGPRKSSAYGYAQAKKSTWSWYKKSTGRGWADRDDFDDAIDFIGWYNDITAKQGVSRTDSYSLYLACLLYTSPSPRDRQKSRMPSSA